MYAKFLFLSLCIASLFISCQQQQASINFEKEEDKAPGTTPDDWMYFQRAYPFNQINTTVFKQALAQTKEAKGNAVSRNNMLWEQAGPLNIGGRVTDIAVHPTDVNTFYVGASIGGVFKTSNGGQSWNPIFDDAGSLSIGNIGISKSNPDVLYVGTGEANGSATSGAFFGDGMYKSTDAGVTWNKAGLEESQHIGRVVVDPTNPDKVFAAVAGLLYGKSSNKGVYRTVDGGASWENVLFISDSTSVIDVAVNPINPDIIYAASWERSRFPWQRDYGGVTSGIWRSTDGGDNWQKLENGLPVSTTETGRIGISISSSNPNVLYASYTNNSISNRFQGVFKTTDGGDNWTQTNDGNMEEIYSSFGWFFGNIRVDPNDENTVYVLGVRMFKTTDGGLSWDNITGNMHVDHHGLEVHPLNSDFVIVGNDGGVYTSDQGGQNWNHINVLPLTQFYTTEIDFSNPQRIYGGAQDNGTLRTLSGLADNWERINGADGFYVNVDPIDNNFVYSEYQFGTFFRSTNGGESFQFAMDGIDSDDRTNWNTPVILDKNDPNRLFYGSDRVYVSFNKAISWEVISDDLTDGQHPSGSSSFGTLTTIALAASDPNIIYVGTDDGNVQMTTNLGNTWTNISNGLPDRAVTRVAVDPLNSSTAFVTISGYKLLDYMPHVFMTTDAGSTWQDISSNLPEIPVNALVLDPQVPNTIYVGTDMGVWYTTNLGESWDILGTNFPTTIVTDLKLHNPTRTLVAATFGRSMQKLDISDIMAVGTENLSADLKLTTYPNPVINEMNVQIELDKATDGTLGLYDVSGKKVKNIFQGFFVGGTNNYVLSRENFPAGTYVLRFQSELNIITKKVIFQ